MNNFNYKILFLIIVSESIFSQSINGFVREEKPVNPYLMQMSFLVIRHLDLQQIEMVILLLKMYLGSYEINVTMIGYGIYKNEIKMSKEKSTRLKFI